MSSQNEGGGDWINRIKGKLKPSDDDIGCGCVVIFLSAMLIIPFYLIIPPFLNNWERPIKVGDLGRALVGVVMSAAIFLPTWLIFSEAKDPFWVKVKHLVFYVLWLVAIIYVLEYCLNAKGISLSDLSGEGPRRFLR
jgi:hypothetical protein